MEDSEATLRAAEDVVRLLKEHQVEAVVIGAVALAAYHYVRQTEDIDLGVNASLPALREVTRSLQEAGYQADLRAPDGDDPLGGVIDVRGDFGSLQIVSFAGRFPAVIDDAVCASDLVVREGSPLKLVPIPHLIALKLYAGGFKSKADIVALLVRNPDLDVEAVKSLCEGYRLSGLDELVDEAEQERP
ncbi:MAG: hypothetical protein HKN82_02630 [Akkermansiaceae bacterium]|nr:hypothetical protein [Akkermansiaceae bacterium]